MNVVHGDLKLSNILMNKFDLVNKILFRNYAILDILSI